MPVGEISAVRSGAISRFARTFMVRVYGGLLAFGPASSGGISDTATHAAHASCIHSLSRPRFTRRHADHFVRCRGKLRSCVPANDAQPLSRRRRQTQSCRRAVGAGLSLNRKRDRDRARDRRVEIGDGSRDGAAALYGSRQRPGRLLRDRRGEHWACSGDTDSASPAPVQGRPHRAGVANSTAASARTDFHNISRAAGAKRHRPAK